MIYKFQSTLPARGATLRLHRYPGCSLISIHAPCTGSDRRDVAFTIRNPHFNPRSLHGERRHSLAAQPAAHDFNPRSLHGERPVFSTLKTCDVAISIHAPCTGSDRNMCRRITFC